MAIHQHMSAFFFGCAFCVALSPEDAHASGLTFFGINSETIAPMSEDIRCQVVSPERALEDPSRFANQLYCKLTHKSFGGVPITLAPVSINPDTSKVRFIAVYFDQQYLPRATKALSMKYGEPTELGVANQPVWRFSNGDRIQVSARGAIYLIFKENQVSESGAIVDF